MHLLDNRTLFLCSAIVNVILTGIAFGLWRQNRRHYGGTGYWVFSFILLTAGFMLIGLRGAIPLFASAFVGSSCIVFGTLAMRIGMEKFIGIRRSARWAYFVIIIFVAVHAYGTFIDFSLHRIRSINLSAVSALLCGQLAWLTLRGVPDRLRTVTRPVGAVFLLSALVHKQDAL